MQNRTHWRTWVAALAFFGVAGSILYAGVLKQSRQFEVGESAMVSSVLAFEDNLDFSVLNQRQALNTFPVPKLSAGVEVGLNLNLLFRVAPTGTTAQLPSSGFTR